MSDKTEPNEGLGCTIIVAVVVTLAVVFGRSILDDYKIIEHKKKIEITADQSWMAGEIRTWTEFDRPYLAHCAGAGCLDAL